MQWRTNVNGTCLTRQQYRFTYDYANRLLTANHFTHNGSIWTNTKNYSESNITYDLNGNLKTYTRRGLTAPATFGVIDQLTYIYGDVARPDRLTNVSEAGSVTKGFKFTSGAAAYQYDLNGNLIQDNHKALTLQYNYLNLPNYIVNPGDADIVLTYTADGEKLTKVSAVTTQNYVSGIEYTGSALDAIYHAEGRRTPNGASAFHYEYGLKDHLGNARVNFRANGAAVTFLQELHYYPFGMLMEGLGTAPVTDNDYKYNGKELNEDLGLNLHDYGARWYDAALGRWWSVDPMGEKYRNWSGYNYCINNPLSMIDPNGMEIVAVKKEDRAYFLEQLSTLLGEKGGKIFSFNHQGYLKVNQKELKTYTNDSEISQEQKDIVGGYNEIAKNKEVRVEFRTVADENEQVEYNPIVERGKNSDGEIIYDHLYQGGKGFVFTVSGAGATHDEGANKKAIVAINRNVANSETYATNSEGLRTSPCASCVMTHEFIDHALPYTRNPNRLFNGGEGVLYHNKSLKIKGSVERNGKDHSEQKSIKRI